MVRVDASGAWTAAGRAPAALRGRPELAVFGWLWKIPGRLFDDPGLSRGRRSVARLTSAILLPPRGRRAGGYGTLPVSHIAGQP
ncbi:hypothetical protein XAC3810_240339 [Xanthomonas citri pv. citri]|uniref:Uncharacterized protein n=1 Tax=Xanthomonas citri pv. citri TaxID=611301 RepID=A0A0U5FBR4_XANCI|nr:hypothetical protein XAC9322_230183 [Xanthomonas citri pv. citri]CEE21226.1 hypothetical protein XAC3824_250017 [Xanthomonas citri pv. citri]CEE22602.1 hypothetical protein XAC1083_220339 [Xanthomonas citri pv. citri]CEE30966.1 hypothetical protein XAC3810_240339 [Xanthomonas citri pv. citri]CEE34203.1 hypothetical protein XAC2911_240017 [Xanthomonas citri pv. citri]